MTTETTTHELWILAHRQQGVMLPARDAAAAWALGLASAFGLTDPTSAAFKRKKVEMRAAGWVARRCKIVVAWS